MATVFKIDGGKNLKYKMGDEAYFDLLYKRIEKAIHKETPEVIYIGSYEREMFRNAIGKPENYSTYVVVNTPARLTQPGEVMDYIRENEGLLNFADEMTGGENYQLLALHHIPDSTGTDPSADPQ